MTELQIAQAASTAPVAIEDMPRATRLLQGLLQAWRDTPQTLPLQHGLTESQLRASLHLLKRMQAPASPTEVGEVIERMLLHYWPAGKDVPVSVKQDWLRIMVDQPFASIVACYEKQIRSSDVFAPKLGQFLQAVEAHAGSVATICAKLEASA